MAREFCGRRLLVCLTLAVAACLLRITGPKNGWLPWTPSVEAEATSQSWVAEAEAPEPSPKPGSEDPPRPTLAAAAARTSMANFTFHGDGFCDAGYYAGWGAAESRSLESCKIACSADPSCTFISFKEGITCSRFDATAGTCRQLQSPKDGYSTYQKVWECDWSHAELLKGYRCIENFENWKGGSKEAMLSFCSSTSFCKGLHWLPDKASDQIHNISKGWFQACANTGPKWFMGPWYTLVKPPSCVSPADQRPLSKTSIPGFCATAQTPFGPAPASNTVDLVVAAFNENLSYLEPMMSMAPDAKLKLYCSGSESLDPRCIPLPNLGGENAVYLHHIVQNYDSLADITVFSVGSIMRNENNQLLCRKLNYLMTQLRPATRGLFGNFSTMAHTFEGEFNPFNPAFDIVTYVSQKWGMIRLCNASMRPLGTWYQNFVEQDLIRPTCAGVLFNGIFAVRAERLRRWPKSKYQSLLAEMSRCGDLRSVADHYMERSWKAMLEDDVKVQRSTLAQDDQRQSVSRFLMTATQLSKLPTAAVAHLVVDPSGTSGAALLPVLCDWRGFPHM
ncbi:unnamed protein product [Symbiodinium microadriaticum]|nr:unnamed protein product [Symbiodinium sp. KB8]CAE7849519.1 unnamed protein product [Symbiodinium microadriaticum]